MDLVEVLEEPVVGPAVLARLPVLEVEAAHLDAHGHEVCREIAERFAGRAELEDQPAGERALARAGGAQDQDPRLARGGDHRVHRLWRPVERESWRPRSSACLGRARSRRASSSKSAPRVARQVEARLLATRGLGEENVEEIEPCGDVGVLSHRRQIEERLVPVCLRPVPPERIHHLHEVCERCRLGLGPPGERLLHPLERDLLLQPPRPALAIRAQAPDPPLLIRHVRPRAVLDAARVDPDELVLIRHLRRSLRHLHPGAPDPEHGHRRVQPPELLFVEVPVHHHVP